MDEFKTFKEITIGGLTKERLISQLTERDIKFNKYADMLFEHPSFSPEGKPEKVKLVKVKLSDLHMASPYSFQGIIDTASNLSLRTCPLYLAAFLRLQFMEQPAGPYLTEFDGTQSIYVPLDSSGSVFGDVKETSYSVRCVRVISSD